MINEESVEKIKEFILDDYKFGDYLQHCANRHNVTKDSLISMLDDIFDKLWLEAS